MGKEKKIQKYSDENLQMAMEAHRKGMPFLKASKVFEVPRTTLMRHFKEGNVGKIGRKTKLSPEKEKTIVDWIKTMFKAGFPVSKETLLFSVEKLAREYEIKFGDQVKPGRKWYEGFMKRHPNIAERTSQNLISSRRQVTQDNIRAWFNEVGGYLEEHTLNATLDDPRRVFNADETAFFLNPKAGKVLAERGSKTVYTAAGADEKQNLTVLVTVNAAGMIAPPMVVYRYVRIPQSLASLFPSTWAMGRSENGWMTQETFFEYMSNVFEPWLTENNILRPVIFFMDGHSSHISLHLSKFCAEKGIQLIALYPNATHLLQPLDVAVFHPLKVSWKKKVTEWRMANEGRQIEKKNFPEVLKKALDELPPSTIISGFKKCGLVPWDPSQVQVPLSTIRNVDDRKATDKVLLNLLQAEIGEEKIQIFQSSEGNWSGDIEDTSLFHLWRRLTSRIKNQSVEVRSLRSSTLMSMAHLKNISFFLKTIFLARFCYFFQSEEPISALPSLTAEEEPIPSLSRSTSPCTTLPSAAEEEARPGCSGQTKCKAPESTTPPKANLSTGAFVPSPFKRALFWPQQQVEKKVRRKERLPSVVTSQQMISYYEKKEKEKTQKDEEKRKKKEVREEKKKLAQEKKQKEKIIIPSSSSSSSSLVVAESEESHWSENETESEEMGSEVDGSVKQGDFVLVNFMGGKRRTTKYVYLCCVQETITSEGIKVMGFKSLSSKKEFIPKENDISIVSLDQIVGIIKEAPEVRFVDRKIVYAFQKCLAVKEK